MQLQISKNSLRLDTAFGPVLRCDESFPLLYVGRGEEHVDMYRGNFKIEDYVVERRALRPAVTKTEDGAVLEFENALTLGIPGDGVLPGQPPPPRFSAAGLRPRRNLPGGDRVPVFTDNKKLTSSDVSFFLFCSFTPAA